MDVDLYPRKHLGPPKYRYSTVLPGRVRKVVDEWEAFTSTHPGALHAFDSPFSGDEDQMEHQTSRSPLFTRNLTRRPRVSVPSAILSESKQKTEEEPGKKTPPLVREPSPLNFSIPATSLLDDIIKLLEMPVQTKGQTSANGTKTAERYIDDEEDEGCHADFHSVQSHCETTDSGFKSLESILGEEAQHQRKSVIGYQDPLQGSDSSSYSFQSGHQVEAITLTAGAHVQRARSMRNEARAARKPFSPLAQQDSRVVPRQPRRSPQPFARNSPRLTPHAYNAQHSDSDSRYMWYWKMHVDL